MLKRTFHALYHAVSAMPAMRERAYRIAIGSMYRQWCALHPCPEFPDRFELYRAILEEEGPGSRIDYLEFGVYKGETIRWWLEHNLDLASSFHGFDSFEGLPVNWEGMPKGSFSASGMIPDISDPRCHFVKGLFHQTLPGWLKGRELSNRLVIHLDADLYGSTLLVLIQMMPHLKVGDILVFDEFHSYKHEFRALLDALTAYPMEFRPLGRSDGWAQLALMVV